MPFLHCSWLPPLPCCPRDTARLRQSPTPLCAPHCSSHVRKPPGQRVLHTGTATARWSWFSRKAVLPLARHSWCLQAEAEHPCWPRKVHENLFCIIIWLRSQIQHLLLQPRVFRLINRVFRGVPSASLYKVWGRQNVSKIHPASTEVVLPDTSFQVYEFALTSTNRQGTKVIANQKPAHKNHHPRQPSTMLGAREEFPPTPPSVWSCQKDPTKQAVYESRNKILLAKKWSKQIIFWGLN